MMYLYTGNHFYTPLPSADNKKAADIREIFEKKQKKVHSESLSVYMRIRNFNRGRKEKGTKQAKQQMCLSSFLHILISL